MVFPPLSFGFIKLIGHFLVPATRTFPYSSGPGGGQDKELGEKKGCGACRKERPSSPLCAVPSLPFVVQLPTAACPGLHSMASSWARPAPSPEAPSTLAATLATAWWDTVWPFVPGIPRATTCGARPFLSVKVRSRWDEGNRWFGSYSHLGFVPGLITLKCGFSH